ncbi:putative virulence related protein PagC [Pantoea allii]|uniref:Putative virulence related protein PagC n=1 Tax=Pantoea allii TaxID=574096 RepID=A0A2V2BD03_9GAMM|nr:Ail/Lom family outer membrane beta-barrel protein [Pantoea allii]MDJ0038471.1 Ail/Lom family outer membrane beta-barrel protein [Pantoea allii]PWK94895.1 putative virulence related protein PagC [Pantoea allii]
MKKIIISTLFLALLSDAVPALATQTLSVGYAQSKVEDFKNMPGVNLQYRYEWDSPVSVLASFTTLENSEDSNRSFFSLNTSDHVSAEYYSLLAGPAYRLNNMVSLYALAGFSHTAMRRHYNGYDNQGMPQHIDFSDSTNAFAYGAGIIINPVDYLSVTLGYEGSRTRVEDEPRAVNGMNIGVGYRF